MSYTKFGLMILTSTVVMFGLMYFNTYAWEHLFFSETRSYMAVLMGAVMAFIMLAFMLGMYTNKTANIAIFAGSIVVFALMLFLVRSQVTVSGSSYMRAMIPHHSIAVLTSERAQIEDSRVRKLADEIIGAQRKEIAEMRYLIADIDRGGIKTDIYEDPPAKTGSVQDALSNTLLAKMDMSPVKPEEGSELIGGDTQCAFNRSPEEDPILRVAGGKAGMKMNGVLVALDAAQQANATGADFASDGISVAVRSLGDEADWRSQAELVFALENGPTVGYRGFWNCEG